MDTYEILKTLCSCSGVPGRERPVMEAIRGMLGEFKCEYDALGGLHVTVREAKEGEKTLLFEAHADRVGLLVTDYLENGFIRVAKAGGADTAALMGAQILIQTRDGGWTTGIVGAPFPYPAKPHNSAPASEYKMPDVTELYVDTGLNDPRETIARGAECLIVGEPMRLNENRVAMPALDDRAGCAALILAAKALADAPLNVGVQLLFSSREEIGGAGAKVGSFKAMPDFAVAVDTGFAVSPDVSDKDGIKMGDGPEIDYSALLDAALYEKMMETAEKEDIPHGTLVLPSRSTGTDADSITTTACGIRTALLSIPIRFMHHPVEVCDLRDVENTAALLAAFAKEVC